MTAANLVNVDLSALFRCIYTEKRRRHRHSDIFNQVKATESSTVCLESEDEMKSREMNEMQKRKGTGMD
jgi:hypothetical protein